MKYIPETALDHVALLVKQHGSQTKAAQALGVSQSFLSSVLKGHRPIPKAWLEMIGFEWRLVPKEPA